MSNIIDITTKRTRTAYVAYDAYNHHFTTEPNEYDAESHYTYITCRVSPDRHAELTIAQAALDCIQAQYDAEHAALIARYKDVLDSAKEALKTVITKAVIDEVGADAPYEMDHLLQTEYDYIK